VYATASKGIKKYTAINNTSPFESFRKRGNIKQSTGTFLINTNQTSAAHSLIASRGIQITMSNNLALFHL